MTAPAFQLGASIPQELRGRNAWVVWKLEQRDGKNTKVPYTSVGRLAKTTDSSTWLSYAEAVALQARGFNGIGYVFATDDPYTGIDFDKCKHDDAWDPEVLQEIAALDSYTEVSQSGQGLHVIVKASLTGLSGSRKGQLEMYDHGRYFAHGRRLRRPGHDLRAPGAGQRAARLAHRTERASTRGAERHSGDRGPGRKCGGGARADRGAPAARLASAVHRGRNATRQVRVGGR